MSPTDNEIHLVLVTCYNILIGTPVRIDTETHVLSWCIKSAAVHISSNSSCTDDAMLSLSLSTTEVSQGW
jgi:hypothetical protein